MRIVNNSNDFKVALERAQSEARNAFGDDSVFIEKYITSPRHIEIQILRDTHGNCVYLGERECSIQRRHQKVVEEAPSAVVSEELRKEMGEAAVRIANACDYEGAGTVEFIADENLKFYFLEMNTRLQVEHPVTELICRIDLVEQQVRVARGEALTFTQDDVELSGHAIELRVYAEDPNNDFLPSIGNISRYREPVGLDIRVDSGYREGMDVPIHYDPMLSKLVTFGETRQEAISNMLMAINDYEIKGVETTLSFGAFVMRSPQFISGNFDTHFVRDHYQSRGNEIPEDIARIAGLTAAYLQDHYANSLHVDALRKTTQWGVKNLGD